jgi:uncharacterized membrane protein (UPF0127 family)
LPSSNRAVALIIVAVVAVLVVYAAALLSSVPASVNTPVPSEFTVNGRTFVFNYTATTQPEREAGLMNKRVTPSTTMLFAFPSSGQWQFWMYDTNTSLDIIWVSAAGNSGQVVYLVTSAQPCYSSGSCTLYTPTGSANYVIEAKAGFAATYGVAVGTPIHFG